MSLISKYLIRLKRLLTYPLRKASFGRYSIRDYVESVKHITTKYVFLGEGVYIADNAHIEGINKYNNKHFSPKIIFENFVTIQQNGHITCAQEIYVGAFTAIAANVTITDINHPYEDVNLPPERQDIQVKPVYIEEECKIYNNAVILPGVKIGKHSVIGANSVVTCDIPPYCIAVGAPAKIVKRYDFEKQEWVRV